MSAHVEYRCDTCAAAGTARHDRMGFPSLPNGWKSYDGQHFCSFDCLGEALKRLASAERARQLMAQSAPTESAS